MSLQNNQFRPTLELLESRNLMASNLTVTLSGGILYVQGTQADDYMSVTQSSNRISVYGSTIKVEYHEALRWIVR